MRDKDIAYIRLSYLTFPAIYTTPPKVNAVVVVVVVVVVEVVMGRGDSKIVVTSRQRQAT